MTVLHSFGVPLLVRCLLSFGFYDVLPLFTPHDGGGCEVNHKDMHMSKYKVVRKTRRTRSRYPILSYPMMLRKICTKESLLRALRPNGYL